MIEADLSLPGGAAAPAGAAADALGGVRALISNAGTGLVAAQGELGDGAEARAMFETNFWSPPALAHELLPGMRGGVIINVTSTL